MGFILDLIKGIIAAYQAKRAARAAAELPQGTAAIGSIDADGKAIEAQIAAARTK